MSSIVLSCFLLIPCHFHKCNLYAHDLSSTIAFFPTPKILISFQTWDALASNCSFSPILLEGLINKLQYRQSVSIQEMGPVSAMVPCDTFQNLSHIEGVFLCKAFYLWEIFFYKIKSCAEPNWLSLFFVVVRPLTTFS